jgi:hypothetical protein
MIICEPVARPDFSGETSMQTFSDSIQLVKDKML